MRFIGDIALDAEVRAIASGAITDGEPVIVNSAGTVSGTGITTVASSSGSPAVFESATSTYISTTFDSNSNKVVIAYRDDGNSGYGTAVVGTVSGTDITYGTPVVFESASSFFTATTFDSNSNRVVIAYRDNGNSSYGTAIVGTVSGTGISFGSPAVFNAAITEGIAATFDSNSNKVVIAYTDSGNSSYGTAIVGTVSSTSISFGSEAVYESAHNAFTSATFDSNSNKVVIVYADRGNSFYGTAIVGTVSSTSISFGSAVVFESARIEYPSVTFDTNSNKVVISYDDSGNSNYGTGIVGTVSGTAISFGSPAVFESATTVYTSATFDSNTNKVVIAYQDNGNSSYGTAIDGTVSGTSISFGSAVVFENASSLHISATFDSNSNKAVVAYQDGGNSNYGSGVVFSSSSSSTNLTSENFIGIANAVYADGQKATVKTTGSIARNVPQQPSASDSLGTAVVFESGDAYTYKGSVYDSNADRIVIFYRDGDDSSYGKAIVGTVSGNSVTFGTAVTFISEAVSGVTAVFDSNSNKVVVFYKNGADSEGRAHVGTVDPSDNSISFGSEATFNAGNCFEFGAAFDSTNNKIVVSYRDFGNSSYGTAIVGTVSSTSITFGSEVVFNSATTVYTDAVYDPDEGRVVIVYEDSGNSDYGTAIVGTVSGTSISFGSEVVFDSGGDCHYIAATYDTTANKVIVAYEKNYDSSHASAIVGTVSGTSISFGSATEFAAASTNYIRPVYVSHLDKTVIGYQDVGDSYKGTYIVGTVSGTNISFNSEAVYSANATYFNDVLYDPDSKKVIFSYWDDTTGDNGTVTVLALAGTLEDLTIGQQYFVQTDGSLGTSADDPSVIAGTAIGTSELIVKG